MYWLFLLLFRTQHDFRVAAGGAGEGEEDEDVDGDEVMPSTPDGERAEIMLLSKQIESWQEERLRAHVLYLLFSLCLLYVYFLIMSRL